MSHCLSVLFQERFIILKSEVAIASLFHQIQQTKVFLVLFQNSNPNNTKKGVCISFRGRILKFVFSYMAQCWQCFVAFSKYVFKVSLFVFSILFKRIPLKKGQELAMFKITNPNILLWVFCLMGIILELEFQNWGPLSDFDPIACSNLKWFNTPTRRSKII